MTLEAALDALAGEGYHDVRFIALPSGPQYRPGRTPTTHWVCEIEPYPGDPDPLYAWGTTREEAAEGLYKLLLKLHPPS